MLKRKPKELEDLVELPLHIQEVWSWFLSLNSTRSSGFAISAISYTEMQAFFTLQQIDAQPYEIDMIRLFDSIAMKHSAERDKEKPKK